MFIWFTLLTGFKDDMEADLERMGRYIRKKYKIVSEMKYN